MPGMYISFWHGLWMPRGVPKDVLAKVHAAVVETLADETVRKRLAGIHQEIPPREQQAPDALAAYQKAEIDKWGEAASSQTLCRDAATCPDLEGRAEDMCSPGQITGLDPHLMLDWR